MYNGLLHAHSGLRWIALALLLVAIVMAVMTMSSNDKNRKNKIALFALITAHIQLLLGIALMFISPKVTYAAGFMKNPISRFFSIEHVLVMLIAIVLITIGYSKSKRKLTLGAANKTIAIYFGIALVLILSRIPWPFLQYGGSWF